MNDNGTKTSSMKFQILCILAVIAPAHFCGYALYSMANGYEFEIWQIISGQLSWAYVLWLPSCFLLYRGKQKD